jgi:hypothetical protein
MLKKKKSKTTDWQHQAKGNKSTKHTTKPANQQQA